MTLLKIYFFTMVGMLADPISWVVYFCAGMVARTVIQACLYGVIGAIGLLLFVTYLHVVHLNDRAPPIDIWLIGCVGGVLVTNVFFLLKKLLTPKKPPDDSTDSPNP